MPEITDEMDVPKIVAQTLQDASDGRQWEELSDDEQKKKESKCKKHLNTIAVEKMSIERLNYRNGLEEICDWFLHLN